MLVNKPCKGCCRIVGREVLELRLRFLCFLYLGCLRQDCFFVDGSVRQLLVSGDVLGEAGHGGVVVQWSRLLGLLVGDFLLQSTGDGHRILTSLHDLREGKHGVVRCSAYVVGADHVHLVRRVAVMDGTGIAQEKSDDGQF